MIYTSQDGKHNPTQHILANRLAKMSEAEFLGELAAVFGGGGPVGDAVAARLLSIAAKCAANEEASRD